MKSKEHWTCYSFVVFAIFIANRLAFSEHRYITRTLISSTTIFHRAFISASLIRKAYIINSINTPFGPFLCNFFENRTFLIEDIIQKQSKMALRVWFMSLCGPKLAVFAGRMICSQLYHFWTKVWLCIMANKPSWTIS